MAELDYAVVQKYWNAAEPSILAPYMMDGFGFPAGAGRFRFRSEARIVQRLIGGVDTAGTALDVGSGMGFWAEFFASRFAHVVAIESSTSLHAELRRRCAPYPNVETVHRNVSAFRPTGVYPLMFFGGMLMYLTTADVIALLRRLLPFLAPGGLILCRETTVHADSVSRQGDYQAVYRSVAAYTRIFQECGLTVSRVERNRPYILLQIGCEAIRTWQAVMPKALHGTPLVGRLAYWGLRLTAPLAVRVPAALGLSIPRLTNHFFALRVSG